MYKVTTPPPRAVWKFIQIFWEEYQVVKRGREYHGCGEEYNVEKEGKGKQYHITLNIEAVGEEYQLGKRGGRFGEDLKNGGGKEYED